MLATFLWKGNTKTKSAAVFIFPFGKTRLNEFALEQIPNSDIWFRQEIVRSDARFTYTLVENFIELKKDPKTASMDQARRSDPFNQKYRALEPENKTPGEFERISVVEMPKAPPQPWILSMAQAKKGIVETTIFRSTTLQNERKISIYVPAEKCDGECGLLLLFDRSAYLNFVPTPTILDNLIHSDKISGMVAVLIDFPDKPTDSRLKELSCNEGFSDFLKLELLPWLHEKYKVSLDPKKGVIAGSSLGGLAATCAAMKYPKDFQNVLSQSGSFWWTPDYDALKIQPTLGSIGEPNKIASRFVELPKLPLRFYMDAGNFELDMSSRGGSILVPNRQLRDILKSKGYEVHWQEFIGGHDYMSWRGTLSDGLIFLVGK